jgi:hypothetical protein
MGMERSFLAYRAHVTVPIRIVAEHDARQNGSGLVPKNPLNQLERSHFFRDGRDFYLLEGLGKNSQTRPALAGALAGPAATAPACGAW